MLTSANAQDTAKQMFEVLGKYEKSIKSVGWANISIATVANTLVSGLHTIRLWPGGPANPIGIVGPNMHSHYLEVDIRFPEYSNDDVPNQVEQIYFPQTPLHFKGVTQASGTSLVDMKKESKDAGSDFPLKHVLDADPLFVLSTEQKKLLWKFRGYCLKQAPKSLPKLVSAVNWLNPKAVNDLHQLLEEWPPLPPLQALQLLDSKFPDEKVRAFAVYCISQMNDQELADYLLQLVQTLKHEPYHTSPLAMFLLLRAIRNPRLVGQRLFWFLECELHMNEVRNRFTLIKKELLKSLRDEDRQEMLQQGIVVRKLDRVAKTTKTISSGSERLTFLHSELERLSDELNNSNSKAFSLAMDPSMRVSGLIVKECRTMQSATIPLWLTWKNADPLGDPIRCIFKVGDDLRQDILTLQILSLMDHLWKNNGLDLHLIPYKCASTGDAAGMIEVVVNSKTTAAIQKEYGGAVGALKEKTLYDWMQKHNSTSLEFKRAVKQFTYSCAGYCVATYVLGIGDRHNDNIMIQKNGNLFHIDFGFFLGNYLKFAGIERETTPFVLTPEMVYLMGGSSSDNFKLFESLCCRGYNILRQHGHLLLTLFSLMLSTGIPQLTAPEDISYLRNALMLDASNAEASDSFRRLIKKSLGNTRVLLNNMVHILCNQ